MKKYIRFEVEPHMPWSRNHLLGIYLDAKGNEKTDRIMCFNHSISMEHNNTLVKELCVIYNKKLEFLEYLENKSNVHYDFSSEFLFLEWNASLD